jgi:hypothetical protein
MENYIIPIFFVAFISFFLFTVFTKKGKGRMFGGEILETIPDEIRPNLKGVKTTIKMHVVRKKNEISNSIGIEITDKTFLSWNMRPLTLSKSEAQKLIMMLNEAINKN